MGGTIVLALVDGGAHGQEVLFGGGDTFFCACERFPGCRQFGLAGLQNLPIFEDLFELRLGGRPSILQGFELTAQSFGGGGLFGEGAGLLVMLALGESGPMIGKRL